MIARVDDKATAYQSKIAECEALRDAATDPLAWAVYDAMAREFQDKAAVAAARLVTWQEPASASVAPTAPGQGLPGPSRRSGIA